MTLAFLEKPSKEGVELATKIIESLWERLQKMSAMEFLTVLHAVMEREDIEQLWRQ